jgi:hypothetical protein
MRAGVPVKACPHSGRPEGCYHFRETLLAGYSTIDDCVDVACGRRVNYQSAVGDLDDACCEECAAMVRN